MGFIALLYNLNVRDYGFMSLDCLFCDSPVELYQSTDLEVAPTRVQHKQLSEGTRGLTVPSHTQCQ